MSPALTSALHRALPITRAALALLILTLLLFFSLRKLERQNAQAAFVRLAEEHLDHLQTTIDLNLSDITALGSFLGTAEPVSRQDFARFTAPLLRQNRAIQALEWAPRVPARLRHKYEDDAHRDGLRTYEFTERRPQGEKVRAEDRDEYYPVYFVEPVRGNENVLGFDLLSNEARQEAIQHAADTGQMHASGRVRLVQETADQYGVLILRPVYRQGAESASEQARRDSLMGVVIGVLRLHDMVEHAGPAESTARSLGIVVTDADANPAERLLYSAGASFDPLGRLPGEFSASRTISVAGRRWQVSVYPQPGAVAVVHWTSWSALIAGLLLTCLWCAHVQAGLKRHAAIERKVAERAQDLYSALEDLAFAHRALQESEARYRKLIDLSPDAIIVGRNQTIADANKAAVELFGVPTADDLIGRRLADFVVPDRRGAVRELAQQMYETEMQLPPGEWRVSRRDGTFVDTEVSVASFRQNDEIVVQAVIRNVTQRKQAEAENARLIQSVEQVAESVIVTDLEARILYVNPAFEKISGYSREEVIGQNARILKSGRQAAKFYQEMWATLLRGETWSGKLINKRKDGKLIQEEATISPVRNRDGIIINYVAVKRDVTEEVLLRDQLNQAQKMEAIGRLAGGVAHDFNNILMVITSYAEMLRSADGPQDSRARGTEQILRAANRAAGLTQQLLAFSRKQIVTNQVVNLNSLIHDTTQMLRRLIGEDVELTFLAAVDLGGIMADPGQIVQVLMNLCVNARDAMPHGGRITIRTREVYVDVNFGQFQPAMRAGRYVMCSVTDTGKGMSDEVKARIFEPFFSTKEAGKGTGLGLATAYGIVKQSGGYIWANSEEGRGSSLECYFPRVEKPEPVLLPAPERAKRNGGGTILLVEDESALRTVVGAYLAACGYNVLHAENGEHALQVAEQYEKPIDLLLTDVVMPKMNGRELQQQLVQKRPTLKSLFMSGYTDDSVVRHGVLEAGLAFLQKPFALSVLAEKLQETLKN